ncbi:uncharacterized protein LOC124999485 [Mugil cephalus]|uniref:uncharacterized protein LOC124999485 n=1 Tax=Mugil cephalus TaxID=48193 RepID=UPI001FB5AEDA|nr:uncharacterized protein LOC124999485 [Mugil cephalus]
MAGLRNALTIFAIVAILLILDTRNVREFSHQVLPGHSEEEQSLSLPHTRQRRSVSSDSWNYTIDLVLNVSDVESFGLIMSALSVASFPIQLDNNTQVTDISITTVCLSMDSGVQCTCGGEFAWPYTTCVAYGPCDNITNGICKCINALPDDGQSCQPISELLTPVEYEVEVELNLTDVEALDDLRSLLNNGSYSLALGPTVNVTQINITTVCYLNDTSYQCRCEDQYAWSFGTCITYGACDEIIDGTCGCINSIPSNGQYCQLKTAFPSTVYEYELTIEVYINETDQLRNTVKNITFPIEISPQINISDAAITTVCMRESNGFQCRCEDEYFWPCEKCVIYGKCSGDANNTCMCINAIPADGQYCQSVQQNVTTCPLTTTSPPTVTYEYLVSIELNTTNVTELDLLRTILSNRSYPISISSKIQLTQVNITTVCSPSIDGFQCRCEDQYRWPCDQCLSYGSCDNITDNTCGCINAIPPEGQYCLSEYQHNFTTCPTPSPPVTPTTPQVVYEYLISMSKNSERCVLKHDGFQCRCEDQYRWPCDQCLSYGSCDNITDNTCGCINAIPPEGQYCLSEYQHNFTTCPTPSPPVTPTTPQVVYEYLISIELNTTDITVINVLRSILRSLSYPIYINGQIQLTDVNISTVCSPSIDGFQCRCEDQYRWPCDQCLSYGSCDNITDNTCGCINAIPPEGQYCLSEYQHNFATCPPSTPTTPHVVYEYLLSIELNTTDIFVINALRSILRSLSYPIHINSQIQLTDVNISTVCSPSIDGFQCRCEDQYRWPCDQCLSYGSCDNITDNTCGCINAIPPEGQYCLSEYQHNFTTCPTPSPPVTPTTPQVVYEYLISTELNTTDITVINALRSLLSSLSYPIYINGQIQLTDVNISTVCSSSIDGFQCRCEDQYRWPCDQCLSYGSCDNITDNTCGCINAIPPEGQYCLSEYQHNFTTCPTPSPPVTPTTPHVVYEYLISTELNTTDITVINVLRSILRSLSYPIHINSQIQLTDVNISTVCSPSIDGFQCRCEDQYRWPCDQCLSYGSCDNITDNTCGCINAIPPEGQYCLSEYQHNFTTCPTPSTPTTPHVVYEYLLSIELNTTDIFVINTLRSLLSSLSYPIYINGQILLTDVNISTVCSPSIDGFQCRCEDQYRWPCDQCLSYGSCDNITDNTCGCINAIPPEGQYLPLSSCRVHISQRNSPHVVYEYLISIELNTTDIFVINTLRSLLSSLSYPIHINGQILLTDVNISTVCSPSIDGFQCRCEDQYRWPCDQCLSYGSCDNITDNTCGCINAIPPEGQYCLSEYQHNFATCPPSTPTTPHVVYEYLLSIELNTTDIFVINALRSLLSSLSYPIYINGQILLTDVNISTVCSPSIDGFQCRCEDQYRWPCDQCLSYGSCDNITDNTCGCINAIPPEGQYCLSEYQHTFAACPTPSPTTNTISTPTPPVNHTTTPTVPPVTNTTASPTTTTTVPPTTTTTVPPTTTTTLVPTTTTTVSPTTTTTVSPTTTTTVSPTTTTTVPTSTTTAATTTTTAVTTTTTPPREINVTLTVRLDTTFEPDFNNPSSARYQQFAGQINAVLKAQYTDPIEPVVRAVVTGFRPGSVIVDFLVQTTQLQVDALARANQNLPAAMEVVAPVIGSVVAVYDSPTGIELPGRTFTGNSMALFCGPPDIDVGATSGWTWKFKGVEIMSARFRKESLPENRSRLTVSNVILADIGPYECILKGSGVDLRQRGDVTNSIVRPAPNVRVPEDISFDCNSNGRPTLECCVQSLYTVQWFEGSALLTSAFDPASNCIQHNYDVDCSGSLAPKTFTCRVNNASGYVAITTLSLFREAIVCDEPPYGRGPAGARASLLCPAGQKGRRIAECQETGEWRLVVDSCILTVIDELLTESMFLVSATVPQFVQDLNNTVQGSKDQVAQSAGTIEAIVNILNTVANVSIVVTEDIMADILGTVDVIIGDDARESWAFLNQNETRNSSSQLLGSMETFSSRLEGNFQITSLRTRLRRSPFNNNFTSNDNSSFVIEIPNTDVSNAFITTISFLTLNNVMPVRNSTFNVSLFNSASNDAVNDIVVNAAVVLVRINATINNVTLSYNKLNGSLSLNPQCVFWNFTLFDEVGAWDDEGCTFVSDINDTVTCNCNHLTSFSILMATGIPESIRILLDVITYVGVVISMASLVICLIIEAYVWKALTRNSTSFMRHVSIVNTALSLLIADICFIIGASIADNPTENPGGDFEVPLGPCSTATFFMHFFYLALFFWMLVSALLLFYRTVMVFSHMSKSTMLAIGFTLGYICPLIIAVVTVAATAPGRGYIRRDNACWLNWVDTMALLAMVIPALTIVFINILIVIVVLFKMLRRGVGDAAQPDEKHTLVVLIRCVAILTPLFGLTWSLGVGTMISSENKGIHIAFAFFNSLQGFFILVFGTLFDSKIRAILGKKLPAVSSGSNQTRSTSGGISSSGGMNLFDRLRGRRHVYHVSATANTNSNSNSSESYMNI